MPTNNFLPVATNVSANVLSQSAYAASSNTTLGQQPGIAASNFNNKALRQASVIASQFAQFICNKTGLDMLDDGNTSTTLTNIQTALAGGTSSQHLQGLGLLVSASAGALTAAIKQLDGSTDPTTYIPVTIGMRSSTATTGSYAIRTISAALSFALSSATTLGMVASQLNNLWLYLLDSDGAGTMKVAFSTAKYDETLLQSTLAESFSATATSAAPAVFTSTAHGMANGNTVTMTGTPPTGFATATKYYVVNKTANTYQLSATPGGTGVTSSSTGSSIVIHIADPSLVSDAVYTSKAIRLIGVAQFNLATSGTWIAASTVSLDGLATRQESIFFSGSKTSTQAVTAAVTDVTMITNFDSHGGYTGSGYLITVPGNYKFTGACWDNSSSSTASRIFKNGSGLTPSSNVVGFSTSGNPTPAGIQILTGLVIGDFISLRNSGSVTLAPEGLFTVEKIPS